MNTKSELRAEMEIWNRGAETGERDNKRCFNPDPLRWTLAMKLRCDGDKDGLALYCEGYNYGYGLLPN